MFCTSRLSARPIVQHRLPHPLCLALAVAVFVSAGRGIASAQNLLTNGSFEAPSMGSNWVPDTEPTSWFINNPNDAELLLPSSPSLGGLVLPATDGTQDMYIDNTSLEQSAVLSAGYSYNLAYDLSTEQGAFSGANGEVNLTISDGTQTIAPATFTVLSGSTSWSDASVNFTAQDSGSYEITLAAPAGMTSVIDNVVLTQTDTPEPTALGLLALGGTVLQTRRRKTKSRVLLALG